MKKEMLRGTEREKSLKKERYEVEGYFFERQWASYLFIIRAVIRNVPREDKILEIGPGGGYVSTILEKVGYTVVTYDVNEHLNPTRVIDISEDRLPEEDIGQFGCVICAEVLEHIPFSKFEHCLDCISALTTKYVIITIPDAYVKRQLQVSTGGRIFKSKVFHTYKRKKIIDIHFWELNYKEEHSYASVRQIINKYFLCMEEGDIRNNLYHHYYLCEKPTSPDVG